MKTNLKISLILNSIIVALFIFGITTSLLNFDWMRLSGDLTPQSTNLFKFFTVDSNVLLAVASAILLVYEAMILFNKRKNIPKWMYITKFIAVSATTLTLLTTVLYLSPLVGKDFWKLFLNNNLFFHLISPVLGIVSFIFFECEEKLEWKISFLSIIPMGIYSIYYIINVYTHLKDGKVDPTYDFYYFASQGVFMSVVFVIVLLLITFGSSLLLCYLREKRRKKLKL